MWLRPWANCSGELGLEVWTPAKLNLFFEVLGKRTDGYHEVETLLVAVDVYDTLVVAPERSGRVSIECVPASGLGDSPGLAASDLPEPTQNLAYRAAALLRESAGVAEGLSIRLIKRIPAAAGLGGASSDAAAALVAANRVWKTGLSREQLTDLARQIGSDVPFFLHGGAAVGTGRGEQIESIGKPRPLNLVIVRPPAGLSTAEVYRACRPSVRPKRVESIASAITIGNIEKVAGELYNALTPAAVELSPAMQRLSEDFRICGCLGASMTGSGSCWFGLCRNRRQARRVASWLRGRGWRGTTAARLVGAC